MPIDWGLALSVAAGAVIAGLVLFVLNVLLDIILRLTE